MRPPTALMKIYQMTTPTSQSGHPLAIAPMVFHASPCPCPVCSLTLPMPVRTTGTKGHKKQLFRGCAEAKAFRLITLPFFLRLSVSPLIRQAEIPSETTTDDASRRGKAGSLNCQFHHRLNLPCSIIRHILSPVGLIFGSVANVEVRLADNSDHRRFIDHQLLGGASVKREARRCPTKNRGPNFTPLRFCRYFNNNDSRLVASRICKRNM
jgi:hypothetical protein